MHWHNWLYWCPFAWARRVLAVGRTSLEPSGFPLSTNRNLLQTVLQNENNHILNNNFNAGLGKLCAHKGSCGLAQLTALLLCTLALCRCGGYGGVWHTLSLCLLHCWTNCQFWEGRLQCLLFFHLRKTSSDLDLRLEKIPTLFTASFQEISTVHVQVGYSLGLCLRMDD